MSDKLRDLLSSLGVLTFDDQFVPLDSLKMVDIVIALEDAFDVDFEGALRPEHFVSVATVRERIERMPARAPVRRPIQPAVGGLTVLGALLKRTGASGSPATPHQQLFWYTEQTTDAVAPWLRMEIALRGPLDRDALGRSLSALLAAHSIFRTAYREVEGTLQQIVLDRAVHDLAFADRSSLAEEERQHELDRGIEELALGIDSARGRVLQARLVCFAPDDHVLQLVVHHIATDGAAIATLVRRLFALYSDSSRGESVRETPILQYVDYAEALVRWNDTPAGRAASAYWRERIRSVVAVDVSCDLSRAAVDAARDAARFGIVGSPLYTHERAEIANAAAGAIAELARAEGTTTSVVYLAALFWLLHRETGQTDVCVEAVTSMRGAHQSLRSVQGMLTTWLLYRVNLAGCTTFRDAIRTTKATVAEAHEHPIIADYYQLVPHTVRRVVFNYVPPPLWTPLGSAAGLQLAVRAEVSQHIKRPWDLHVNLIDGFDGSHIRWTGNEHIFTQRRLSALLQQYLGILVAA